MKPSLRLDTRGTSVLEYALVLGLAALVVLGAMKLFGTRVAETVDAQGRAFGALNGDVSGDRGVSAKHGVRVSASGVATVVDADETDSARLDPFYLGGALAVVAAGAIAYAWKRNRSKTGAASAPRASSAVENALASVAKWIAIARGALTGRLPWSPRE